jgi:hypothetical protein
MRFRAIFGAATLCLPLVFGPVSGFARDKGYASDVGAAGATGTGEGLPKADGSRGNDAIVPGTTITTDNWRSYRQFMPDGMVALFEGSISGRCRPT